MAARSETPAPPMDRHSYSTIFESSWQTTFYAPIRGRGGHQLLQGLCHLRRLTTRAVRNYHGNHYHHGRAGNFRPIWKVQKRTGLDIVGSCRSGGMADARDSKSRIRKGVWGQVPPPVLIILAMLHSRTRL